MLAPTVEALGLELLGVEYLPAPGSALLRLYIDVPARASSRARSTIEDCEAVSREVSALLDVDDPISGHYTLEVSSPGIDRPLFSAAQFARFVGEQAKVALRLPQDGRRRLQGAIAARRRRATSSSAQDGKASSRVRADNIDKARLVPDLAALGPGAEKTSRARPQRRKARNPPTSRRPRSRPERSK